MGIPNYQEILDLFKNGLTLEAREKILELREAVLRLQEENLSLKEKLKQSQGNSEAISQMHFEKGAYWVRTPTEDGANLLGPYCQICRDRDKKTVRLHPVN